MSRLGAWSAVGALAFALLTAATWNVGGSSSSAGVGPDGRQLFVVKGCATCHAGPDTAGASGPGFPSLRDASEWAGTRRPGMTAEDYLTESIAAPGAFVAPGFLPGPAGPTTAMPQIRLTSDEIDALVAYLLQT